MLISLKPLHQGWGALQGRAFISQEGSSTHAEPRRLAGCPGEARLAAAQRSHGHLEPRWWERCSTPRDRPGSAMAVLSFALAATVLLALLLPGAGEGCRR